MEFLSEIGQWVADAGLVVWGLMASVASSLYSTLFRTYRAVGSSFGNFIGGVIDFLGLNFGRAGNSEKSDALYQELLKAESQAVLKAQRQAKSHEMMGKELNQKLRLEQERVQRERARVKDLEEQFAALSEALDELHVENDRLKEAKDHIKLPRNIREIKDIPRSKRRK